MGISRQYVTAAPDKPGRVKAKTPKPVNKIAVGLREAIAVARGDAEPARVHVKATTGRPRIEDKDKTNEARKPWLKAGMSRSSWYRRQKEAGEK